MIMNKDIKYCPWAIDTLNGHTTRVFKHNGYRCGLTKVKRTYPHAPVYVWTLQFPDGHYQEMDLAEVNKLIFDTKNYED